MIKKKVEWECSKNKKQELFLSCPAYEAFFGGQAGGGKSEALVIGAIGDHNVGFFNNQGWKALLLRRTFSELEKSLILRSQQLLYGKAKYDSQKHRWSYNGAIIDFGHLQNEEDIHKYRSAEYNYIGFDELTQFTERQYLYLFSRNRSKSPEIRCFVRSASNPMGIGHGWVKERFIKDKVPFKIYQYAQQVPKAGGGFEERTIDRCFIPSGAFDNRYLMDNDPNYIMRLNQLPDIEKRALMYGDWDIESGQFFSEFCNEHICEPFDIPLGWNIWLSMDWGFQTKCAIGFYAQDPVSEIIYRFDEIYVSKKQPEDVAYTIKAKLGMKIHFVAGKYADKRILVRNDDTNVDTKERFANSGLHFSIANHDHRNGNMRCHELLSKDKEGNVKFKVFRTCKEFIRVIPDMVHNVNDIEDIDPKCEKHIADEFRYFAIMRKHKNFGEERNQTIYNSNSVSGYISTVQNEDSVKNRISRVLTSIKPGINYYIDK